MQPATPAALPVRSVHACGWVLRGAVASAARRRRRTNGGTALAEVSRRQITGVFA